MKHQGYSNLALITLLITAIGTICFCQCISDETYCILGMTHEHSTFCSLSMGVLGFLSYCIAYKKLQYFAAVQKMEQQRNLGE